MGRKKSLVPRPGYMRYDPYVRQSDQSRFRLRVVLGVCKESGCSRKTLDSDFCRSCMAKMKIKLERIQQRVDRGFYHKRR